MFVECGVPAVAVVQGGGGEKFLYRILVFGIELSGQRVAERHQSVCGCQRAVVGAAEIRAKVERIASRAAEAAIGGELPVIVVLIAQVDTG